MYQTTFQIKGTNQQPIDDGLTKWGLSRVSLDKATLENEIAGFVDTLDPQDKQRIANGDATISLKSVAKFRNEHGTVIVIDYDLVKVQKDRWGPVINWDPIVIVNEVIPGILSEPVRAILEEKVKVDIIKSAIVSIDSDAFKTSVADLARLTEKDPDEVYRKCVTAIMHSCIIGMQRLDMFSEELPEEEMQQQNEEVYN